MKGKFVRNFIVLMAIALVAVLTSCKPARQTYEPEIKGVQAKITAYTGDVVDFMAGVTATDKYGEDATSKVTVTTPAKMDEQGRLTQSGTYTVKYVLTIDGVAVTQTYSTLEVIYKKPDDQNSIISNGDFASGTTDPFTLSQFENGNGSFKVVNEELVIDITAIAAAQASPRVEHKGIALNPAKYYEIKFDARANVERWMHVQMGELLAAAPWFKTIDPVDRFFHLTTTMQTFSFRIQPSQAAGADMNNLALLFEFGKMKDEAILTSCFMDNISITEVSDLGEDTTAPTITAPATFTAHVGEALNIGVTAVDDFDGDVTSLLVVSGDVVPVDENGKLTTTGVYNVIYTVSDNAGNESTSTVVVTVEGPRQYADPNNLFGNPSSEVVCNAAGTGSKDNALLNPNKWNGWYVADPSWNNGQPATLLVPTFADGVLTVAITQGTNTNFWANQIFYATLPFEVGGQFTLSLDINSTKAGKITVAGQVLDLVVGDNHFELTVSVAAGASFLFEVQFGVDGLPLGDSTVKFSNIQLGEKTDVQYADPDNLFGEVSSEVVCDATGAGGIANSKLNPNQWHLWYVADPSWNEGQPATLLVPSFANGILTVVSTQGANTNFWANQMFYTTLPFEVGGQYKLTLDINSTKAGKITIAGSAVDLLAGDNHIQVLINVADKTAFTLEVQFGVDGLPLGDATLVFSNASISEINETELTKLATPAGFVAQVLNNDTFYAAWENVADAASYKIFIYNAANEQVYVIENAINGLNLALKDVDLPAGTYTAKIQAIGNGIQFSDSDLSAASGTFDLPEPQGPVYADPENLIGAADTLYNENGTVADEATSKGNPGKIAVWFDKGGWVGAASNAVFSLNGSTLTLEATQPAGAAWFATQVFYTTLPIEVGGDYELSLNINASVAGKVTVNGTVVDLVQGDNTVKVKVTVEAKTAFTFSFQLGVNGVGNSGNMTVVLSNLHLGEWVESGVTKLSAPLGFVAQLLNNNTTFYAAWQGDANAVAYKIFLFNEANEQVYVIENPSNGMNKPVAEFALAAGTYTAKIQAIGDGTTYSDSDMTVAGGVLVFPSTEPVDLTKLPTPMGFVAQVLNGNTFFGAWQDVANASSYKIYIYNAANEEVFVISNATNGMNKPVNELALPQGTYTAKLQAIGNGTVYSDSDKTDAAASFDLPEAQANKLAAPLGFVAQLLNNNTSFYAAWEGAANVVSYKIFLFNEANEQVYVIDNATNGMNKPVADFGLAAGTYTAKIQAIGNGTTYTDSDMTLAGGVLVFPSTEPVELTKLATPVGFVAQVLNGNTFFAAWQDVANAASYKIYIYNAANEEVFVISNATNGMNKPVNELALPQGTYTAKLQAIGNGTVYSDSDKADASASFDLPEFQATKLATPVGFVAEIFQDTNLRYAWAPDGNAQSYKVYIFNEANEQVFVIENAGNGVLKPLSELALAGGTYTVKLQAVGNGTTYLDSDLAAAPAPVVIPGSGTEEPGELTKLATPVGFVAQNFQNGNTNFYSAWAGVANAVSYTIHIYDNANVEVITIKNATNGMNVSFSSLGFTKSGSYTARLQAIADGVNFADSDLTAPVGPTTFDLTIAGGEEDPGLPKLSTPIGFVAQNFQNGNLNLYAAWQGVPDAVSYSLHIYNDANQEVYVIENATNGLNMPFAQLGLTTGTYTAKLQAIGDGIVYANSLLTAPATFIIA